MKFTKFRFCRIPRLIATALVAVSIASSGFAQVSPQVATGDDFTLAIDANGNLYSYGNNDDGQLGAGDTSADPFGSVYVFVPAGGWIQVAASRNGEGAHALAIREDGTLWAWGSNDRGQLGIGSTVDSDIPVQVGTAANWEQVVCGSNFSYAINSSGQLYGWGITLGRR